MEAGGSTYVEGICLFGQGIVSEGAVERNAGERATWGRTDGDGEEKLEHWAGFG